MMDFLTDARLPESTWEAYGKPTAASWDDISRRAGVVAGAEQWATRLSSFRDSENRRFGSEPPEWAEERLARIDGLGRFIADLDERLRARPESASLTSHLAYLHDLFGAYLNGATQILNALADLVRLDALAPDMPFDRFRTVVEAAIDNLRSSDVLDAQQGAFGLRGVNVLDVNSLRHLRFHAVAVVGLAERSFPPPPRQDPLLLDDERMELNDKHGWSLPLRARGVDPEPLQFALAAASADERLQLSYPRAAIGSTRLQLPSSFFRAAASALVGAPVRVEDVDALPDEIFERVPAGRLGSPNLEMALTPSEYDRHLPRAGSATSRCCDEPAVRQLRPRLAGRKRLAGPTVSPPTTACSVARPRRLLLISGRSRSQCHRAPWKPTPPARTSSSSARFCGLRLLPSRRRSHASTRSRGARYSTPCSSGSWTSTGQPTVRAMGVEKRTWHACSRSPMRSLPQRKPAA